MNVLFVCARYYPIVSASPQCVESIVKQLNQRNLKVDVLDISADCATKKRVITADNYKIYQYRNDIFFNWKKSRSEVSIFRKVIIFVKKVLNRFYKNKCLNKSTVRVTYKALKRIANDYQVIIPVVADLNTTYAGVKFADKNRKRCILYQLDPIAGNKIYADNKQIDKIESRIFNLCDYVITTKLIKKTEKFINNDKVIGSEFPNLVDYTKDTSSSSEIIIFYCGILDKDIRDCRYALELFKNLNLDNVKLVIAGNGQEEVIEHYKSAYNLNIEHLGVLTAEECKNYRYKSNFLLNIGNAVTNMVPSKIFDYFGSGKPIINVYKNKDCPTLPYFDRYNLSINLFEDNAKLKEQSKELNKFITDNNGVRLQYTSVKKTFYECTPEYVSGLFMKLIEQYE